MVLGRLLRSQEDKLKSVNENVVSTVLPSGCSFPLMKSQVMALMQPLMGNTTDLKSSVKVLPDQAKEVTPVGQGQG